MKRRIKVKNVIIAVIILILLLFNICLGIFMFNMRKIDNKDTKVEIIVNQGMSVDSILTLLEEENLIRNKFFSKIYIKLGNYNMQAGTYELSTSMNSMDIIKYIATGKITTKYNVTITFKEGKNIRQYISEIVSKTNNTEGYIYNLLDNEEYIDSLIEKYWFLTDDIKQEGIYYPLEGYLFPETYTFKDKDVSVEEIFAVMLNQTDKILTKYKDDIASKNLNIHEFISLASVVELESRFEEDRKEIAGVFYNRLAAGDMLGSDVTTYYAVKKDMTNPVLLQSDLDFASPYNTRHPITAGKVPIGAIGNPGESSIEACINPKETDNYYFVADCSTRKTVFTKTYSEHVSAVNKILQSGCKF